MAGLMRLNMMKTTFIRAGQRLKIPGKGGEGSLSPPASAGGKTTSQAQAQEKAPGQAQAPTFVVYKVSTGDTLFSIAQKFGMELSSLLALNNLTGDAIIQPGQELRIQPKK